MPDPAGPASSEQPRPAAPLPAQPEALPTVPRVKPADPVEEKAVGATGGPAQPGTRGGSIVRGHIPKAKRRFRAFDPSAPSEPAPAAPAAPASWLDEELAAMAAAEEESPSDATEAAPNLRKIGPDEGEGQRPKRGRGLKLHRPRKPIREKPSFWWFIQAVTLGLAVAAFFVGRATVPRVAPPGPAAPGAPVARVPDGGTTLTLLTAQNAARIDGAMAAEQTGDFATAHQLLEEVAKSGEPIRGLDLQRALLAMYAGDAPTALTLLNQSISKDEEVAECYRLRGTIETRKGGGQAGLDALATAAALDPFEARHYFFWGEALRRAGQPREALVKLHEAMDRLREPELESLYGLKLRLTQVELGEAESFAADLARQMSRPDPPLDWLLTAAAVKLQANDFGGAATSLERAISIAGPAALAERLHDFYLNQFRDRPELTRFFTPAAQSSLPAASAPAVDFDPSMRQLPTSPVASPAEATPH